MKVKSKDKFKSAFLFTPEGVETSIEILGEKKKAVGPGSVIEYVLYKKMGRYLWGSTLSSKIIERDDFVSKLREAGLIISSKYKENERVPQKSHLSI